MSTARFRALRIFEEEGRTVARFVALRIDELDPGEVLIRNRYSSVNYKDALAATGAGKVIRRFPCIGGIDAAGEVVSSSDARFQPGEAVIVTGYQMGVAHDGGYAAYVRVPADWVVPLPEGLSLFEAMALGTAGFTAALAIYRLEQNELRPENGKVIVTGATGGVSGLAIQMLAQRGYEVVALTGKTGQEEYLMGLGARAVWLRDRIDLASTRPLEKAQWGGALDAVGGTTLAWLLRSMQQEGCVASYGNAGGAELHTTVFPFILRGVKLLGIDSAATAMPLRKLIWQRLAHDLRPLHLDEMVTRVPFAALPQVFPRLIAGQARGRHVVEIAAQG